MEADIPDIEADIPAPEKPTHGVAKADRMPTRAGAEPYQKRMAVPGAPSDAIRRGNPLSTDRKTR
jgi:hypothetical protein